MKIINLLTCLICLHIYVSGQNPYYVGHSLINLNIPFMVKELRTAAGHSTQYRNHINNGASLKTQWSDPAHWNYNPIWTPSLGMDVDHGTNFMSALSPSAALKFDHVIITESVPLLHNPADTTIKYGKLFHNLALTHKNPITSSMMQTWEYVAGSNYANWRNTFNTYITHWENRVNGIQNSTAQQMKIIPCGLALAALYDTLQVRAIGSLSSMSQLFSDDIHLNHTGNAFMAYVMYACIYRMSPEGLPAVKAGPYTNDMTITDATVRSRLQKIAWRVASTYPHSPAYSIPLAIRDVGCFDVQELKWNTVKIHFCLQPGFEGSDIRIQKSKDGINFVDVQTIKNPKSTSIQIVENWIGIIYYRLASGSNYSEVKTLNRNKKQITPNIVTEYIMLEGLKGEHISLINTSGQVMMHIVPQSEQIDVSGLPSGFYYVKLENQTIPFVKF
jgi:hypothetical protein